MPSARNLLAAAGGSGGSKPPLPTYPTFPENTDVVLYANELTWFDDDASETENTYRNFWRGELVTVRYPFQNIAISFFQAGQHYTNYDGTKLIAQVFDYRNGLTVIDSGPQEILDLTWHNDPDIVVGDPAWSSHIDVVSFGDRLLLTVMYNVDNSSPTFTHGLAFCSVSLNLDTLELTVHWDDAFKFPTQGTNWAYPGNRTLGSDPWGDVVCHLWHWNTGDARREVAFFKLTPNELDPNVVDAAVFGHEQILEELDWSGINLSNSFIDNADMPPLGERILSPWCQFGVEHYKDDLWFFACGFTERREEYLQETDFERHWPIYAYLVEVTEESFTLVDELRVSADFGDVPAGLRVNESVFFKPMQWNSYHQHGIAIIDDSCFFVYQDYNDDIGDYARYARIALSDSTMTLMTASDFPVRGTGWMRNESHWSLTKCDGKIVFLSTFYGNWGSNDGYIEMSVIRPDGSFEVEAKEVRSIFEANVPSSAWFDNTARAISEEAVRQTFDLQNSKIMPMVLPDEEDWNHILFVLSHLDALINA